MFLNIYIKRNCKDLFTHTDPIWMVIFSKEERTYKNCVQKAFLFIDVYTCIHVYLDKTFK
ncbi:hypothetical protein BC6307_05025 [Sutcliffiella cohnii]|uniref:Uncharacterized protein n=1 Tax=Sutcliffiella cohnii TaxID=33932 RepID=A0A223KMF6_9BACI|nr:hypothetical protein BC6307_05025 [Sutcliffiella cohnii]